MTGLIARLTGAAAPANAARVIDKAETVGFTDVSMTYRPASGALEVRGTLPDDAAELAATRPLNR